ncbi:MAG: DUF1211 domain-containing protein [Acidobacteria bacterium]|nr:DUF1211 domain-containing protein [Acidobacteriota bacterium]
MPDEKETGRLEAFSDGVFAIAITLLILEIRVPKPEELHGHLLPALTALWPSYLAFVISFATILVMWVNHHRIFALIRRSDHPFLYWNGFLLMMVTLVPFPTAVLAAYLMHPEEAKVAAGVFAGTYFFIALAFNGLWRHASKNRRLLAHDASAQEVDGITKQYRFGPVLYLVAFAASFFSVGFCVGLCLALAVFFAVRGGAPETA